MQNTQGYCANCNTERMLTAEDTGFGTIGTVLLICMLGPIGLLIVLMGRGRGNWRCAVCGTSIQIKSTQNPRRSTTGARRWRMSPIIIALLGCCGLWWVLFLPFHLFLTLTGASTDNPETTTSPSIAGNAVKPSGRRPQTGPRFSDEDMVTALHMFREFSVDDYRTLPNCLDVFGKCVAVPHENKTRAQYKSAVSEIARQPCRVVLDVVDVPADYDFADFILLDDDGTSALIKLQQGGNIRNYAEGIKGEISIGDIKSKGLDWQNVSIGDRVVLVGLGYIVSASSWGASDSYRVPKGDERYIMLRAFGKPLRVNGTYEFAFMVRNWYIASQ